MSRRTDLLQQLIQSDKWGEEKTQEQKFLAATAELILTDLINIAMSGVEKSGAGSLIIAVNLTGLPCSVYFFQSTSQSQCHGAVLPGYILDIQLLIILGAPTNSPNFSATSIGNSLPG